jgi:hypothetical protein
MPISNIAKYISIAHNIPLDNIIWQKGRVKIVVKNLIMLDLYNQKNLTKKITYNYCRIYLNNFLLSKWIFKKKKLFDTGT